MHQEVWWHSIWPSHKSWSMNHTCDEWWVLAVLIIVVEITQRSKSWSSSKVHSAAQEWPAYHCAEHVQGEQEDYRIIIWCAVILNIITEPHSWFHHANLVHKRGVKVWNRIPFVRSGRVFVSPGWCCLSSDLNASSYASVNCSSASYCSSSLSVAVLASQSSWLSSANHPIVGVWLTSVDTGQSIESGLFIWKVIAYTRIPDTLIFKIRRVKTRAKCNQECAFLVVLIYQDLKPTPEGSNPCLWQSRLLN